MTHPVGGTLREQLDVPELPQQPRGRPGRVPLLVAAGTLLLVLVGGLLFWRAQSKVNKVALVSEPKRVTVIPAAASSFRPNERYVGTLEPWVAAKVGPQFISAYVDTVLVRPGAFVKRGAVLATLDCRNASALHKAVSAQARAVQTQQEAMSHEAKRISELGQGGFVSPNEIEQKAAESASKQSQYLSLEAQQLESSLKVNDCVLRAPFDGDVVDRTKDPGGFVNPGMHIVTVVDRNTIRLTAEVPEDDFAAVTPGAPARIRIVATGEELSHEITRRAPAADPGTRTVHIEIDLPNANHRLPVYTTAEISIDVGEPRPVTQVPLAAASVRGKKADLFLVSGGKAHLRTVPVVGESGGSLFLDPSLDVGSLVVLEGRTLLGDGDRVTVKEASESTPPSAAPPSAELPPRTSRAEGRP